eukprot:43064-Prorocentrum_minimum.AAC.3
MHITSHNAGTLSHFVTHVRQNGAMALALPNARFTSTHLERGHIDANLNPTPPESDQSCHTALHTLSFDD